MKKQISKIQQWSSHEYGGKIYNITRESLIKELTWPFEYKTKLNSNNFILNFVFGRNIWNSEKNRSNLNRITKKYNFIFLVGEKQGENKLVLDSLSDDNLINFAHDIYKRAFNDHKKTSRNKHWSYYKSIEIYREKSKKEFEKLISE